MPFAPAEAFRKTYFINYVCEIVTKNLNVAEQSTLLNPGSYEPAFQTQCLGLSGFTDPPTFQNVLNYLMRVPDLFFVPNKNEMIVAMIALGQIRTGYFAVPGKPTTR